MLVSMILVIIMLAFQVTLINSYCNGMINKPRYTTSVASTTLDIPQKEVINSNSNSNSNGPYQLSYNYVTRKDPNSNPSIPIVILHGLLGMHYYYHHLYHLYHLYHLNHPYHPYHLYHHLYHHHLYHHHHHHHHHM